MSLTDEKIKELQQAANTIRQDIIKMLVEAGSGHTAGPLGMADVFTLLYFHTLNHRPKEPQWEGRDRLVLSNGHICPVQYAAMARAGYFDIDELATLRKFGSRLQGHPHREFLPGVEVSSGPLGSGLSQALGMALADRLVRGETPTTGVSPLTISDRFFYCLMGDGELNEGQVWEAALHAGKEAPYNLIGIIDRNDIQIDGHTGDVMPLEPLKSKWESFGWHTQEVDGHNFEELDSAIELAKNINDKPSMIIAITIPGKGVPEIERDYRWHGKPPSKEEGERFLKELQR